MFDLTREPESTTIKNQSFWLIADNSIDISTNISRYSSFIAHLKHALLFNEKIIISDSLAINTPNFRKVLQNESGLAGILANEALVLARRQRDGAPVPLCELRDEFARRGAKNPGFLRDGGLFLHSEDLNQIEIMSNVIPFNLSEISHNYTKRVLNSLNNGALNRDLGSDREVVSKIVNSYVDSYGHIDQAFFWRDGPDRLESMLDEDVWARVKGIIREYESVFYRTSLPTQLSADIIFSKEHSNHRKIIRNIDVSGYAIDGVDICRGGNSLYEDVLVNISSETIKNLRNSDEFWNYQSAAAATRTICHQSQSKAGETISNFYRAINSYHEKIDRDTKILRYYSEGTNALDRWHLSGVVRFGEHVVRLTSKIALNRNTIAFAGGKIFDYFIPGAGEFAAVAISNIDKVVNIDGISGSIESFYQRRDGISKNKAIESDVISSGRNTDTIYR